MRLAVCFKYGDLIFGTEIYIATRDLPSAENKKFSQRAVHVHQFSYNNFTLVASWRLSSDYKYSYRNAIDPEPSIISRASAAGQDEIQITTRLCVVLAKLLPRMASNISITFYTLPR